MAERHSHSANTEGADANEPRATDPSERIVGLDALRGFALLGILVINIQLFGQPLVASVDPTQYGDFTGMNYVAWLVSHVFFEQKFVTLFTFMFGTGMVLFLESKKQKNQQRRRLHLLRNFWLLLIGLGHAYLFWYGDILVAYALCGFLVVWVWQWRPRRQFLLGAGMLSIPALLNFLAGVGYLFSDGETREEIKTEILAGFGGGTTPSEEISIYQSGWLEQMSHRVPTALEFHTIGFVAEGLWLYGGLMIIGMALYQWGVIDNSRSTQFYRRLFAGAGTLGLALVLAGVWVRELVAWEVGFALTFAIQFNYWGAPLLAVGYLAGIMLLTRRLRDTVIVDALAAVGRTAFSNYLFQTVVATTIFYGHGFGLFAELSRIELFGVVVVIWVIQILLSMWWLSRYQFGPMEWLWRTLTYQQRQPLTG